MAGDRNPLETLSDQLAAWIVARAQAMPTAKVPFGARKLSGAEQWQRYVEMKDDPQQWAKIVQERGPEGAVEFWSAMQKLGQRHGETKEIGDESKTEPGY